MSCDTCFNSCPISWCATTIYVGDTDDNDADFAVYVQNISTGRIQVYPGSTNGTGVLSFTPDEFLKSNSQFKIWAIKEGENEKQDIYPYTNTDTPTFDTDTYTCGIFSTYALYEDEDMYILADQYLKIA